MVFERVQQKSVLAT